MFNPGRPTQQPPAGAAGPGPADRVGGASSSGGGGQTQFDFGIPMSADMEYELDRTDVDAYDEYDYYDYGPTRRERIRAWSGRMLVRLAWLGLAAVLAFGSAGMVAATSHSPALGGRPELTWGADQILTVKLDGAVRDLVLLNEDVTQLGNMTRDVLSNLTQVNDVGVTAAQGDGNTALAAIENRTAALRQRLDCGPWTNEKIVQLVETYSSDAITRYQNVCVALDSVTPLHDDWGSLVAAPRSSRSPRTSPTTTTSARTRSSWRPRAATRTLSQN